MISTPDTSVINLINGCSRSCVVEGLFRNSECRLNKLMVVILVDLGRGSGAKSYFSENVLNDPPFGTFSGKQGFQIDEKAVSENVPVGRPVWAQNTRDS